MCEHIDVTRADGLPTDAWLRTHVRIGGKIVKIAPYSMTIIGTIAEWLQPDTVPALALAREGNAVGFLLELSTFEL
jgi:hypothetical protein